MVLPSNMDMRTKALSEVITVVVLQDLPRARGLLFQVHVSWSRMSKELARDPRDHPGIRTVTSNAQNVQAS